jgi:hypothetical protein
VKPDTLRWRSVDVSLKERPSTHKTESMTLSIRELPTTDLARWLQPTASVIDRTKIVPRASKMPLISPTKDSTSAGSPILSSSSIATTNPHSEDDRLLAARFANSTNSLIRSGTVHLFRASVTLELPFTPTGPADGPDTSAEWLSVS